MKKLILFLSLILSVGFASAQSEIPSDSIRRAPSAATYSQGFSDAFSPSAFSGFGYGYGWGLSSSPQFMQMGSFKLKNGMRINTYGDYDKDGWRVPNRSAMPWEKNNFRGAFELKSANGNFGIRIEVQQGRRLGLLFA